MPTDDEQERSLRRFFGGEAWDRIMAESKRLGRKLSADEASAIAVKVLVALRQCDIRGCAGVGRYPFNTEDGELVNLCERHRLIRAGKPERMSHV